MAHGHCVGIRLPGGSSAEERSVTVPEAVLARLHPEERQHFRGLAPGRQLTWVGGRLALRQALDDLGIASGAALLPTTRGAPSLPAGAVGSISHKEGVAVALAAPDSGWTVGVDVELGAAARRDIAPYVLTPGERQRIEALPEPLRAAEVLWAFSAKEALYKALDPHVGRHVSFQEASVERGADGAGVATLSLRNGEGPFEAQLGWLIRDQLVVTTARVRRHR
jgi:4'-phosphopantetheinyl transferase EntD